MIGLLGGCRALLSGGMGSGQDCDMRIWEDLDFGNIPWLCYSRSHGAEAENLGRSGACDRI